MTTEQTISVFATILVLLLVIFAVNDDATKKINDLYKQVHVLQAHEKEFNR